jgi:hypothetical protein
MSSQLSLLSFAITAILALSSLPVARAEPKSNFARNCFKFSDGHVDCSATPALRAIIIGAILILSFITWIIVYAIRRRRYLKDVANGVPPMGFAPPTQGATLASTYDPNGPQYPASTYPFVGHGAPGASAPVPPAYAGYPAPHQGLPNPHLKYPTPPYQGRPSKEYV